MSDPPNPSSIPPSLSPTSAPPSIPSSHPSGPPPTPHQPSTSTLPPPSRPTPSTNPPPAHATAVDPAVHATLLRDYQRLKRRVELLERENEGLRTSLWEVSWRWGKQKGKDKANQNGQTDGEHKVGAQGPAQQPPVEAVAQAGDLAAPGPTQLPPRPTSAHSASTDTSVPDLTPKPSLQAVPTTATTTPALSRAPSTSAPPSRSPSGALPHRGPSSATSQSSATHHPPHSASLPASSSAAPPPSAPQSPTPSSLAASLFPSVPAPAQPPSSAKSYDRSASLHRSAMPSSLRRDDRDREREREGERWKWGRAYELKAHRGAVYSLKFAGGEGGDKGIMLGSGGFDGVRVWKVKSEGEEGESDKWDEGDVDEIVHLTSHAGPVSDLAFSPSQGHIISGGYDSAVHLTPLSSQSYSTPASTPTISSTATFAPPAAGADSGPGSVWSHTTDGLVQSVCWVHPGAMGPASESGNLFAWGTSGKVVGLGDLRMKGIVGEWKSETGGMINTIQSFRHSPYLLIGDSLGQTLHFSLQTNSFLTSEPSSVTAPTNPLSPSPPSKKQPAISCFATNPAWQLPGQPKAEPRWMAGVGFDNFVRIYDRSPDPLRAGGPKLVQTLKGKNRNWPIKAAWFQGPDYADYSSSRRRTGAASTSRSRSGSFDGGRRRHHSHQDDSDEDDDDEGPREGSGAGAGGTEGNPARPLSSSLLVACGSSDPVVLLYDLSGVSQAQANKGGSAILPQAQRLEGHKESVYAVDFLQATPQADSRREEDEDDEEDGEGEQRAAGGGGYTGEGLLASAGGDWTVRVWKPVFLEGR